MYTNSQNEGYFLALEFPISETITEPVYGLRKMTYSNLLNGIIKVQPLDCISDAQPVKHR